VAAIHALQDTVFVRRSFSDNQIGLSQLVAAFEEQDIEYIPSFGNFVTIKLTNAATIHKQLLAKGIIVRPLASQGLTDWLRVSVGLEDQNNRFIQELSRLLQANG
jgi:histidinol-phosphate aminotransferase